MEEILIRNGISSDIPQIIQILQDIGWFNQINSQSINETIKNIKNQFDFSNEDKINRVFVAEHVQHSIVGYCFVHIIPYFFLTGPEAFISDLFIKTQFQNQGIGTKLINAIIDFAKKNNFYRIGLLNNRERPSYQRKIYEKIGFTERSTMANFIMILK